MKIVNIKNGKRERFNIEGLTAEEFSAFRSLCKNFLQATDNIAIYKPVGETPRKSSFVLIDLGLSSGTLWADRNVGADKPEDYGDYFRFGEITPFTEDSPEYEYDGSMESIAGTEHDAATFHFGHNCHTPTFDQINELFDECEWKWTLFNGVNGFRVTGPNGNSIFLPAAGYRNYSSGTLSNVGSYGYYWSATPVSTYSGNYLYFSSSNWDWYYDGRAIGFSVRPVCR